MNPNDFAMVRLADTGEGGMLNVTMVDKNDPNPRAVIVYDHGSGEFFDAHLVSGRKVVSLDDSDVARLLALALSQVARRGPRSVPYESPTGRRG